MTPKQQAALLASWRDGLGAAALAERRDGGADRVIVLAPGFSLTTEAGMVPRWWCRRFADAERVAAAANARLRRADSETADAAVTAAARRHYVALMTELEVAAQAASAIERMEEEFARAQRAGELRSLNADFRAHRLEAAARGEKSPRYADFLLDYKCKLLREMAAVVGQR